MKARLLLAIEGGGTKTRVLLAKETGDILERWIGGPASGLYTRPVDGAKAFRALLEPVRKRVEGLNGRIVRIGMGGPMDVSLFESVARDMFGSAPITRVGERQIALAVYGLGWGVALIAGTGASCTAVNESGQEASCGGCGPQFGDEGSGYWIGREAIAAAMRMADGRLEKTALADRLCAFYSVSRIWDVLNLVERGSGHVSGPRVAACVPVVFELARNGEPTSSRICRLAGRHLARLVCDTVCRVSWKSARIPLVLAGGVFNGKRLITAPFAASFRQVPVPFTRYPPVCEPAEGLVNILCNKHRGG
ncbi:MAG TPA: BadF/BadG/BcrA/BcrD ATPase family protein [Candidatus Hydrogenedentes bacterium]|nr:BadF/BadG/BcrA/BcrD ATPase family protein [Candidatus Hydrogenedentota bacterium]